MKTLCRHHDISPRSPILCDLMPVLLKSQVTSIHPNTIHSPLPRPSNWSFPSCMRWSALLTAEDMSLRATWPAHLNLYERITYMISGTCIMKSSSSLCILLHTSSCWSNTAPHILRRTPFSNTFSLRSNLSVSLHVSDPYGTTGRTILVYAFSFILRDANLLDNKLFIDHKHRVPAAVLSVISASTSASSVSTELRYVNLPTTSTFMPHNPTPGRLHQLFFNIDL